MAINIGNKKTKLYLGNNKVKKVYLGSTLVYSSGNVCTYRVDEGTTYQEEVDEGESCLSPKTFAPAKPGWTFVGWRQDNSASSSVLDGLAMGDNPITLYAVFKQVITLSYNGNGNTGGSTAAQTGTRYYNNGNVTNPTFMLSGCGFSRSGYNFSRWAIGNAGGTQYTAGAGVTLSQNTTFYAVWVSAVVTGCKRATAYCHTDHWTYAYFDGSRNPQANAVKYGVRNPTSMRIHVELQFGLWGEATTVNVIDEANGIKIGSRYCDNVHGDNIWSCDYYYTSEEQFNKISTIYAEAEDDNFKNEPITIAGTFIEKCGELI